MNIHQGRIEAEIYDANSSLIDTGSISELSISPTFLPSTKSPDDVLAVGPKTLLVDGKRAEIEQAFPCISAYGTHDHFHMVLKSEPR